MITICLTTWPRSKERVEYCKQAITSVAYRTKSFGDLRHHVEIVCSIESQEVSQSAMRDLTDFLFNSTVRWSVKRTPANLGANLNRVMMGAIWLGADYILLMDDDYMVPAPLDLSPYCDFLDANQKFAMVRLSWTVIPAGDPRSHWIKFKPGEIEMPNGGKLLEVDPQSTYFYAQQPHLRRAKFHQEYGWHKEGGNHGEPECELNAAIKAGKWRMAASPVQLFKDCGAVSSISDVERWA